MTEDDHGTTTPAMEMEWEAACAEEAEFLAGGTILHLWEGKEGTVSLVLLADWVRMFPCSAIPGAFHILLSEVEPDLVKPLCGMFVHGFSHALQETRELMIPDLVGEAAEEIRNLLAHVPKASSSQRRRQKDADAAWPLGPFRRAEPKEE